MGFIINIHINIKNIKYFQNMYHVLGFRYMNKLIETSMKKYFQLRSYRIELWKKTALASQELIFFDLLRIAKGTVFGKKYHFSDIHTLKDYQTQVPISSYEDIQPYIQKALDGEEDVLWPGNMKCFSKSSGTTNDVSKYIPVSHDALYDNNYQAGRDLYSLFFKNYPESDLFKNSGSGFSLGGSFITNEYNIKVEII